VAAWSSALYKTYQPLIAHTGGFVLLDRSCSQLLVVDVQERFMSVVHEAQIMVDRCAILVQAAQKLGIPTTITEQYRKGLGPTTARLDDIKGDAPILEKTHFSCANDQAIVERVRGLVSEGRSQILVCSIESHRMRLTKRCRF
jgi:nicotinamidase-related amidase